MTEKYVKISGTNAFGQPLEKFYIGTVEAAERAFLLAPADQGGAVSWSTEEIETLPDRAYIDCPCGDRILNPNLVVTL